MPWDSLPGHIDQPEEWKGTDDDQVWWMRWRLKIKGWFAYSYRSKYWWARWRPIPKTLFALRGKGMWRYEDDQGDAMDYELKKGRDKRGWYLSRVQYYCRWSIRITWPFFIGVHWYTKPEYVPKPWNGEPLGDTLDGKLWNFYIGAARDADRVYWFPSGYMGRNWK